MHRLNLFLSAVILALCTFLTGCIAATPASILPPTSTATFEPSATPPPIPTRVPSTPTPSPQPSATPSPTATPRPAPTPITGYWIQNTTADGLCSNAPRLVGFDSVHAHMYVGGDGASVCHFGWLGLERWARDSPSPIFGFPGWITTQVSGLQRVYGGQVISPPFSEGLGMPAFAGRGGRCALWMERYGETPAWRCLTRAEGLPFTDVRGYDVVEETGVEWFMAPRRIASLGYPEGDRTYNLGTWVEDEDARFTWLDAGRTAESGVWVGTNGSGLLQLDPVTGEGMLHTVVEGLPHDEIRDVQVCGVDCVWVATAGGVGVWDGDRWRIYTTADGLPGDDVRGVSFDDYYRRRGVVDDARMWAATAAGAAVLPARSEMWMPLPFLPSDIELTGVMHGVFSTHGEGLVKFVERPELRGTVTRFTTEEGLPDDRITALALTPAGLLVGTPSGAVEGEAGAWAPITGASVQDASTEALATSVGLWVRGEAGWTQVSQEPVNLVAEGGWYATSQDVCRWHDETAACVTTAEGAPLADVQALYTDLEGMVTLAVDARAAWLIEGETLIEMSLRDLAVLSEGEVNDVAFHNPSLPTHSMEQGVWLFATPEGIYEVVQAMAVDDLSLTGGWPVDVRQISVDTDGGSVWIATNQGAFRREPDGDWRAVMGLPSRDITTILALPGGGAWIGTADAGLLHVVPRP